MFMGASDLFCVVYVNVWARSKLMYVSIQLHLVWVMQSTMCVGVVTLKQNTEYFNRILHKNGTIQLNYSVTLNTASGALAKSNIPYMYAIVEMCT